MSRQIYAAFSVVEAYESVKLVGTDRARNVCPKYATLADVVIAGVWRASEVGSIPTGCTKYL